MGVTPSQIYVYPFIDAQLIDAQFAKACRLLAQRQGVKPIFMRSRELVPDLSVISVQRDTSSSDDFRDLGHCVRLRLKSTSSSADS
jgi:hypothetical protein